MTVAFGVANSEAADGYMGGDIAYAETAAWNTLPEQAPPPIDIIELNEFGGETMQPTAIIFHWWGGTGNGEVGPLVNTLKQRGLSVQFGITSGGEIYQLTEQDNTRAAHAKCGNPYSIGFEIEGPPFTDAQIQSAARLSKHLMDKYKIPLENTWNGDKMIGVTDHATLDPHCAGANGKPDIGEYLGPIKEEIKKLQGAPPVPQQPAPQAPEPEILERPPAPVPLPEDGSYKVFEPGYLDQFARFAQEGQQAPVSTDSLLMSGLGSFAPEATPVTVPQTPAQAGTAPAPQPQTPGTVAQPEAASGGESLFMSGLSAFAAAGAPPPQAKQPEQPRPTTPEAPRTQAPAAPVTPPTPEAPKDPFPHFRRDEVPPAVLPWIEKAAAQYGLDPALLAAQQYQESSFRADAVSPTDAKGIAQFKDGTWSGLGIDANGNGEANPFEIPDAVMTQGLYLSNIRNDLKAAGIEPTNEAILSSYVDGPGAVQRNGGPLSGQQTPNYLAKIKAAMADKFTK